MDPVHEGILTDIIGSLVCGGCVCAGCLLMGTGWPPALLFGFAIFLR